MKRALWRIVIGLGAMLALGAGYLLLWPVPVEPRVFEPPPAPALEGDYAANDALQAATPVVSELGRGPEDIAFDSYGHLYVGLEDGRIVRVSTKGGSVETFAETGGRPLGLQFDATGSLIVADAKRGLLKVAAGGRVTQLATSVGGRAVEFANDLDIAADGKVYFSEASTYPIEDNLLMEVLESAPHGRFLVHDPDTRETRVLVDDLYFANGVALAPDDSYVLVAETVGYRIRRHYLAGERRGETDTFVENLPGFPDNLWADGENGLVWLALSSPRVEDVENLQRSRFLRKVIMRLPSAMLPAPEPIRHGIVLAFDWRGRVVHNLQDPDGSKVWGATSVEGRDGHLYVGTITGSTVYRLPRP
jgi:sugar lactone lactonase YvrE